ncbi:hypothetical protein QQF64_020614 [Cirrhinus molitorella]|uniref:non-specific serine/threonine protein kinase n=1 Tax=Cirrhinus molitorella TaxID=172907 RepID=A0ABR3LD40_9TELE
MCLAAVSDQYIISSALFLQSLFLSAYISTFRPSTASTPNCTHFHQSYTVFFISCLIDSYQATVLKQRTDENAKTEGSKRDSERQRVDQRAGGAGENSTDLPLANPEASPAAAAMENSPTEKPAKRKKTSLCAFFRKTWQTVKSACQCRRRGNKVAPLQPVSDTDSSDPQCGPSGLEPSVCGHLADPQPDPSCLHDNTDPPLGLSSVTPTNCDEKPADPEPAEENQTNTKKKKKKHICGFFRRTWRAVKRAATRRKKHNKVVLLCPQPDTDDDQPDPCIPDLIDPQPDPTDRPKDPKPDSSDSDHESDQADSFSGPSGLELAAPKCPGASKHRRLRDGTRFRAACFTDPTPASFDEIYVVGRKIGQGGFGTVYAGTSKLLREEVAIKIIPKRDRDRFIVIPGCSKPLFTEVALNLLLKRPPLSPYIVYMLEWFEEKNRYILILERQEPCNDLLKFMLNDMQLLDEAKTRSLMYQVALAAKHCLDRGVFHRDIKLNNLLINTKTNQVKLIDFGCGDLIKPSGYVGGFTGGVCPPEYYKDLTYRAEPTTVWSLGFMMYSLVYKRQPFRCLEDMMNGKLRFRHTISTELHDLICRCMTLDPTKRATIEEVLQHEWLSSENVRSSSASGSDQMMADDDRNSS